MMLKKQMGKGTILAHHEQADFGMLLTCSGDEELIARLTGMVRQIEAGFPDIKLKFAIGVCYVEKVQRRWFAGYILPKGLYRRTNLFLFLSGTDLF